jgi:hypothetical protein
MTDFNITTIDKGITADILEKGLALDKQGVSTWLKDKSLLQGNEELNSFQDLTAWTRTGGETYSTVFSFSTDKGTYNLIAKAIVTTHPEKSLLDWTRRRKILLDNHIPVSTWLWTGEATIIEPFYPKDFTETANFDDLIKIGFLLDKLGFTTLKFLDDLRCNKDGKPYYIDFGFDLGEPSENIKASAKEYLIKMYPNKQNLVEEFYKGQQI